MPRKIKWFEIGEHGSTIVFDDGSKERYDPEHPKVDTLWPVSIVKARYRGYEGGVWLAFNVEYYNIPMAVYGDDISCATFFEEYDRSNKKKNPLKIGRGDTPDEAAKDLVAQYYA